MNRRQFVRTGLAGGATLIASSRGLLASPGPPTLTKFVDPLRVPVHLPHSNFYHITMNQAQAKLHRDLPSTPVWSYNSDFVGVVIEAFRGMPVTVRWDNQLPSNHLFPEASEPTIHGSTPDIPAVKTVVHLHGAKVLPQFDGYPESWFTNEATHVNAPHYRDYRYPNDQPATQLWFHDHAIGTTRLNFYAGLIGPAYFIRDNVELNLGLPINPPFEVPLVIMDRYFTVDANNKFTGTMLYDTPTTPPPVFKNSGVTPHHPVWATELWADTALVNGVVYPFLNVEPRVYRFRTLNACNSRFLHLSLQNDQTGALLPFYLIGTDQGFRHRPVKLTSLLKGNAERHDILVDFSKLEGHTITMINDGAAPYPAGGGGPDLPQIMQFRVVLPLTGKSFLVPPQLTDDPPLDYLSEADVRLVRDVPLDEIEDTELDEGRDPNTIEDPNDPVDGSDESGSPVIGLLELKHWAAPTSIFPKAGSTEIWRFINATPDTHPIHVHLVEFQVLDRQQYNVAKFKATRVVDFIDPTTGNPYPVIPAEADEVNAPKDVVRASVGMVTRIKMKFDLPSGTVPAEGEHFKYVVHCHILEHEDNEMMRPFEVIAS